VARLRSARIKDLDRLEKIVRAAFAPYAEIIGKRPAPMDAEYATAIRAGRVILAEKAEITGVAVLEIRGREIWLDTLAVLPGVQGSGTGTRLVAAAEDWARQNGARELKLYTNAAMTRNLTYYPRLGFEETHRAKMDGFDRVFFTKKL
jgi:N-acetylglutamate synthase-like GNAT family acetyltransferase